MIDRTTKRNLALALAILWAFAAIVFKEARDFLFWIPLAVLAYVVLGALANYSDFKKCRRFLEARGGAVLSHNATYSRFDIDSDGKRMEITIRQNGKWSPETISFAAAFEKEGHQTFSLSPRRMGHAASDDNLVLGKTFRVSDNTIPSTSVEQLLWPVAGDLLECLDATPFIMVDGRTLVAEFRVGTGNKNVDRNWFERYLKITHGFIDGLSRE
jgi:hypothetical protein